MSSTTPPSGTASTPSAGHYLPSDVSERIGAIAAAVDVPVIFHGHNNLPMAVANSVAAVEAGATIIDACVKARGSPY